MATVRVLTGLAQLAIAIAAVSMALGYMPDDARLLAVLVGIHNAVLGGERVASNGKSDLSGD